MLLIADCGGTSIDWALIADDRSVTYTKTDGYNAAHAPRGALSAILDSSQLKSDAARVDRLFFYGAGCSGDATIAYVEGELKSIFPNAEISVASDMLGAARALCGNRPGVACILGTGSNSCLYDGQQIVDNTPPLGYILGDEGGGASIGKRFLSLLFKGHLSEQIQMQFAREYPSLDKMSVIERVYRGERPAAFLGSVCHFLSSHIDDVQISEIVVEEFQRFFKMNLAPYGEIGRLSVNFVGSIASHFEPQLRTAAQREGYSVGHIVPAPIALLAAYHIENFRF
ncbi:MAG: ATPase [Duncaniella sp.]|nr:ATPase [Duncaniella sp.]